MDSNTSETPMTPTTPKVEAVPEAPGLRRIQLGRMEGILLPTVLLDLQMELIEHPAAHAECIDYIVRVVDASGEGTDWLTKLSAIAAHVGIMVDGRYDAAAIEKLAGECLRRLQAARVGIINTKGGHGHV